MAGPAASSSAASHEWDACRRDARKLEGEVDMKLGAYAKLCATFDGSPAAHGPHGGPSTDQLLRAKASEIESLLQRLSDVNERMGGSVPSGDHGRLHTLARHRDILQDYGQEVRRLNASVGAARDRAELMARSEEGAPHVSVQVQGALLRERNTIASSTAAIDEVIGSAHAVEAELKDQRRVFEGIGDRLYALGSRFPVVNGLLRAIARRKSRDTIVLSVVVSACILVLLVFLWRR
ncbi:unnamed protein product [Ostreobium quekettii]|uniref:Golgi SNAP receptor complex member 1 n=1 Tax=Ostreobium quekettii TaxID=121088 RepID=A0A8S1J1C7_9CHLO|nr:unnamed protein product [Ostreobium quekettii]